jgi:hypothetical protein
VSSPSSHPPGKVYVNAGWKVSDPFGGDGSTGGGGELGHRHGGPDRESSKSPRFGVAAPEDRHRHVREHPAHPQIWPLERSDTVPVALRRQEGLLCEVLRSGPAAGEREGESHHRRELARVELLERVSEDPTAAAPPSRNIGSPLSSSAQVIVAPAGPSREGSVEVQSDLGAERERDGAPSPGSTSRR